MENTSAAHENIRSQFNRELRQRTASVARKVSIAGFFFIVYVVYFDLFFNDYPIESFYWRLLPLSILALLTVFAFTPFKKFTGTLNTVFFLLLISIMIMSWGRLFVFIGTDNFHNAVNSMVVGIICVFLLSREGLMYFITASVLPSLFFIPYLFLKFQLPRSELNYLGNPLIVFFACLFMVVIQNRLRFNEFKYKKVIEEQNIQLQEKDDQMLKELLLAKKIQKNLIPQVLPSFPGVMLHSIYRPMEQVGGDFFNFIQFPKKSLLGIFIGDVSGHGVPAALITSMIKTLIDTAGRERLSPLSMLQYINDKIMKQTGGNFVTLFYAIYDSEKRTLLAARGGHTYPILIRKGKITELIGRGRFLGMMHDIDLEEKTFQLESGDKIVLYTDGLTEMLNTSGELFEKKLRSERLAKYAALPIKEIIDNIYEELIRFRGNEQFADDVCILGIEII